MFEYPQLGFHFVVTFELFPPTHDIDHTPTLKDIRFQSVSGLTATVGFESYKEGGENRFTHHLPTGVTYQDLVLKRGLFLDTQIVGLIPWVRDATENFEFRPANATISLLNDQHIPLFNWYVKGLIPLSLSIPEFNATSEQIVVEEMKFKFQYFYFIREASVLAGAAGLIADAAVGGSVDVSFGI